MLKSIYTKNVWLSTRVGTSTLYRTCFRLALVGIIVLTLQGCNSLAYTNKPLLPDTPLPPSSKASFKLDRDHGSHNKTLFVLALSGGGSRAAYWSTTAMLKLKALGLLQEVDAISAISGGSIAATYYALSADGKGDPERITSRGTRPTWNEKNAKRAARKHFIARWFGNMLWPHNIARSWLTAYDRTDIMAETLANNLFDNSWGRKFTLGELNPNRPNLILNATISSCDDFSEIFTFTTEDFEERLQSDVNQYTLGRAVMGSATFPAAFNSMTLRNYGDPPSAACLPGNNNNRDTDKHYIHIIDGGSHDNLGLTSAKRFLEQNDADFERIVVVLIDAFIQPAGISNTRANPRSLIDYIVDTNFMESVDALMNRNRESGIWDMVEYITAAEQKFATNGHDRKKKVVFYHVSLDHIWPEYLLRTRTGQKTATSLRQALAGISTSLQISKPDQYAIDQAADILFHHDNVCLQKINHLIRGTPLPDNFVHDSLCVWRGNK